MTNSLCTHSPLIGLTGTHTCPLCKRLFLLKEVEVVGSNCRPVPYRGTYAIPTNEYGWYVGEGKTLD